MIRPIVISLVLIGLALVIFIMKKRNEGFATGGATVEDSVVTLYSTVLDRQPTAKELVDASRDIKAGRLDIAGLRQRIMDSDEYVQLIKMQSNALTPELDRMLSDQATLAKIAELYLLERDKEIPSKLVLPYKDIFAVLKYDPFVFRAFLRHAKYPDFEDDVLSTAQLDKDAIMLLFNERFKVEDLVKDGDTLRALNANQEQNNMTSTATKPVVASVDDRDSDMTSMLASIQERARKVFDKDAVAKAGLPAASAEKRDKEQGRLYLNNDETHEGNPYVLRGEYAWSVPQSRPPVCTTLGQPALKVAPLLPSSKLMLGLPIQEARDDTQIGSIMPKWEYKEYIDAEKAI